MNIFFVPFGGFPCAMVPWGLVGQYRYGARTGGANVTADIIFLVLAIFSTSPQVHSTIAVGVLGAPLVFVWIEMSRHSLKTDSLTVTVIIGIPALVSSMIVAFLVGMVLAYLLKRIKKMSGPEPRQDTTC